ncbi:TPA: hypothetical protein N0F65_010275 [Lagenidium giganteum]|uniref:Uncharacterized protein n=1 Tax=Lagenidium giganteum TaxID=4803 RepID=A0AAV2YR19_9STRA|nr:TPA: hypothetical protein N0F65_010275 [Lagenidium giganteum]
MRSTRSSESSSDDADSAAETAAAALYLLEVATEVIKLVPLSLLQPCAIELESLVASLTSDQRMQHQVQCKLFDCISQNCDSEKRAWLAAWLIELNNAYPTQPSPPVSIEQLCDHPSQRQLSKL